MTRTATWLFSIGVLLFVAVIASQGLPVVLSTLSRAGWGLILVAVFHLLPLCIDAAAIWVLFGQKLPGALRDAILARWAGESVNSLLPAGQLGGPVLMARRLAHRGMPMDSAAAAITVSTTMQTIAQIVFALMGVALLGAHTGFLSEPALRSSALIASAFLGVQVAGFYLLQRRGLFGRVTRVLRRFSRQRDWTDLVNRAEAIDTALLITYQRPGSVALSFVLNLLGWIAGVGEVYLIVRLLGTSVSWGDALLLESLGQAIRGAAFFIPGALGVQEGGYLLLAPLAGLPRDAALALSLAKRARELMLGVPGLVYLRMASRGKIRALSKN